VGFWWQAGAAGSGGQGGWGTPADALGSDKYGMVSRFTPHLMVLAAVIASRMQGLLV